MLRNLNIGGIALAVMTLGLIWFGNYCGNRLCIFYWFHEPLIEKRLVNDIPLSNYGLLNLVLFNGLCLMAVIAHLRAGCANPGLLPKDIEVPDYVDTALLNSCEKCDMRWKPMRAHHCSECETCVYRVSFFSFTKPFLRWTTIAHG
jgi:hypothetical protein